MSEIATLDTDRDWQKLDALITAEETAMADAAKAETSTESLNTGEQQAASNPESADTATAATDSTKTEAGAAQTDPAATEPNKQAPDPNAPKPGEPAKEQSRYAKELERRDKSWKALNAEKEALAKAKAEFEAQQAKVVAPKYTADQYDAAAEKFEAAGKYDLAEAAREKAKELRANPQAEAEARGAQESAQHQQALDASWQRVKAEMPEALDKSKPFNAALLAFIKAEPELMKHPNGPYLGAVFVRNQLQAEAAKPLQAEVETLRAKVKELEARVTVPGSGLSKLPAPKAFNEMTADEQERELERQFREESGG